MGVNNSLSEVIELQKVRIIPENYGLTKEDLTEKDLYCIAKHIQINVIKRCFREEHDILDPCQTCKYERECFKSGYGYAHWDTFIKLSKITGVRMCPGAGFID
ncbi:hypothetical protein KWK96_017760 [Clostridioides difficile]|nr:hypothetical protein [Clostridioides difficile]HBF6260043.1 hypothetical protein [Clostridioides difficile]HBY2797840.1 hypothetical protein [Clostridioides difficile]